MKKKANIKVTFLIETLSNGGAERVTSVLANSFIKKGIDVSLIIFTKDKNEYLVDDKIKRYYLRSLKSSIRLCRFFKRVKEVNKIIMEIESDVIISLAAPQTNMVLITCLLDQRKKVILSERNDPMSYPKSKKIRTIRKILYHFSDIVVFQTYDAKKYFSDNVKKKGVIIANPIKGDLPQYYEGERMKEIVNFCRIDAQKNLTMLINAFELLLKDYPDYILSIYGKGPLENKLKVYSQDCIGKNKVYFRGYQDNIHEKILKSAMFVSSSNYEGISNSMLESLAIGLPTISTDCPAGGARMYIDSYENGILIPVGDTIALYKAMKEIIENQQLASKISKSAIKIRDKLSTDNIVQEWLDII